jgi:hypothetical protein
LNPLLWKGQGEGLSNPFPRVKALEKAWYIVDSPGLRFTGPPSLPFRAKRVKKLNDRKAPLSGEAEERGDKRSDVGVSRYGQSEAFVCLL